ncbi:variable surface protein [Plasmodium gonderi]|uniref:Variable surface protein n=1 Tax=Plasmodium gonderi TaxID=77519 RepID=A0A1Y1JNY5_PLAGO|nr:variable surface protein [Plasmodium gonderi]GAW83980.1 variable surface protein [Plasmodium gonderi]
MMRIKNFYYNGNVKGKKHNIVDNLLDFISLDVLTHNIDQACLGDPFGDPEKWKKEKDLHDYFENFKKIRCNDSDIVLCQKYVNYVRYIDPLYQNNIYNCCDEDEIFSFTCNPSIKCDDEYEPQKLLFEINKSLESLSKKGKETFKEETALQQDVHLSFSSGEDIEHNKIDITPYNTEIRSSTKIMSITDVPSSTEIIYDSSNSNVFHFAIISASVIGTMLFFLYYHMSTKLGSRSHKKKLEKKKNENNYRKEFGEESSTYDLDSMRLDAQERRLYLIYNSV